MNDTGKEIFCKIIAVIVVVCISFVLWFRLCGGNVSDDGRSVDPARGSIRSAEEQAESAGDSIESAGESNRDAQETTERISDSNRELSGINEEIKGIIERGESIIAAIRRGGEEDSEED